MIKPTNEPRAAPADALPLKKNVPPAMKKAVQHEEAQLDKALKATFPASDPVAELPVCRESQKMLESEDLLLDIALALTFPASDPIAVAISCMPKAKAARPQTDEVNM